MNGAAPDKVPQPLIEQLAVGGLMVIPVGVGSSQNLRVIEKRADGTLQEDDVMPILFVPMTGKAAEEKSSRP